MEGAGAGEETTCKGLYGLMVPLLLELLFERSSCINLWSLQLVNVCQGVLEVSPGAFGLKRQRGQVVASIVLQRAISGAMDSLL